MADTRDFLLDTNVLVHYARGSEVAQTIENTYCFRKAPFKPLICSVTLGELRAFAYGRTWGPEKLEALAAIVRELVVVDIHAPEVIDAYARIAHLVVKSGKALSDNDKWIAACAHATGSTLVTADNDFTPLVPEFITRVLLDAKTGETIAP